MENGANHIDSQPVSGGGLDGLNDAEQCGGKLDNPGPRADTCRRTIPPENNVRVDDKPKNLEKDDLLNLSKRMNIVEDKPIQSHQLLGAAMD
jgi:hypothetical protein